MLRWEYKHLRTDGYGAWPTGERDLNDLGKDGWELADISHLDKNCPHFWFKRPLKTDIQDA